MTQGVVFALVIAMLVVVVAVGFVQRNRASRASGRGGAGFAQHRRAVDRGRDHAPSLVRVELPGLYLLRPRFLTKAESVVYLLLKAAFPRNEIFARVRLADVLQVKIGPQAWSACARSARSPTSTWASSSATAT